MKEKLNDACNVIVLSDLHFGKKNDSKLYKDLEEYFLSQIPTFIKDYDHIDMIVIAGDVFDKVIKMNEMASSYVIRFIEELCKITYENGIKFRVIKGTKGHDYSQLNNFLHLEVDYPNFKIITTASKETFEFHDYVYEVLYLPEEYIEDYSTHYKGLIEKDSEYDFIFGHGMIDFVAFTGNVKVTRNEAVHSAETLDNICNYFTVFGHIHDYKNYNDMDKIFYTGSFERFSFEDQETKGYLFLRVDPETDETEALFYENENASVYTVLNLSDYNFKSSDEQVKFIEEAKSQCDYLKVIVPEDEENAALLKGVISDDIKVESKNTIPKDVVDDKFLFLINRELPVPDSIQRFINVKTGKNISIPTINKYITETNNIV